MSRKNQNVLPELHITKLSGKLKGFLAINTNPLSNVFCSNTSQVCSACYAKRMLQTYRQTCVKPFEHNSKLLSSSKPFYIPRFNALYVRLHAFGELINKTHWLNFCLIADSNPSTTFVLWTKRTDLVTGQRPSNLRLIYSETIIDPSSPSIPSGFNGTFCVTSAPGNCSGACADCLTCYERDNFIVSNQSH